MENMSDALERMEEEVPLPKDWPSEVTWWLFKEEQGFDDRLEKAGDSLQKMFDRFEIYPVQIEDKSMLYLARFEFPKHNENFQFPEALLEQENDEEDEEDVAGFIDFLSGWPMGSIEMLMMVGELSSRKDKSDGNLESLTEKGALTPPVPDDFFEGYAERKIMVNWIYLDTDYAESLVDGLKDEPEPEGLHWWVRINITESDRFPVPGEFLALGARLMPDRVWGEQKSSPFLFSGNWLDMVFYTSGIVKEVQDPTEERPYPLYKVQWRKQEVQVKPSDFAEYQVGDRVTIIKDLTGDKPSQLWKDQDMETFDTETWVIAPINFYGLDQTAQED